MSVRQSVEQAATSAGNAVGVAAGHAGTALRGRWPDRRAPVVVALAPWLVAHAVVALALLAVWRTEGLQQAGGAPDARGLWVWDAGLYRAVAERGYGDDPEFAVQFFPLVPLLGRLLGPVFGGRVDVALLVVASAAALAYAALLVRLVRLETGDDAVARRVAWLAQLAPGAGVLVLAYTEAVAGALAVGFFLALRRDRPLLAVPLGLLSGLARPTAPLLVAVVLLEVAGRVRRDRGLPRTWPRWAAAAASPLVGVGLYGLWVGWRFGDPLLPYSLQTRSNMRGGLMVDPTRHLFRTDPFGLDWRLQLALLLLAAALLVVVAVRLPPAYGVWSALTLAAAVSSSSGHSLPRYVAGTFPLLIGAALLLGRRSWLPVLLASTLLFGYVALLGFTSSYVL